MTFATIFGVIFIPLLFVVVRRIIGDKLDEQSKEYLEAQSSSGHLQNR